MTGRRAYTILYKLSSLTASSEKVCSFRSIVAADHLRGESYVTYFIESLALNSALETWG